MANETELANYIHQTDVVAAQLTAAFVAQDNVFPLMLTETFPDTTNVIKFAKSGSLTAEDGAESTAYTFGANSELTDSSTTCTGVRKEVASKLTLEAARFGSPFNAVERIVQEQARALARLAAADLKTLFSSISGGVTAGSTLTKDDLMDARYTVVSGTKSAGSPKLVAFIDYKGANELGKELTDSGAAAFNSQVDLGILGIASAAMPKGDLFDVLVYETDGLPTSGGDDVGCVWDPALCFAAGVDGISGFNVAVDGPTSQTPWFEVYSWTYWHIAEHNDAAGCKLLSDT